MELLTLERRATTIIAWITVLTGTSQLLMAQRLLPQRNGWPKTPQ